MGMEPTGRYTPLSALQAGAEWQQIAPESGDIGTFDLQQDQDGARNSAERSARLADIGLQAQALGIRSTEGLLPESLRTQSTPLGEYPAPHEDPIIQEASDASLRAEQHLQQRAASLGVPPKNPTGLKAVRMLEDVKGELTPEEYGHVEGIIRAGQFGAAADLLNKREKELTAQAKAREKAQADAAKAAQREQERAQKEAQRAQERAQKETQRTQAPAPTPTPQEVEVANDTPTPPSSPVAGALASLQAQAAPVPPPKNRGAFTARQLGTDSVELTHGETGAKKVVNRLHWDRARKVLGMDPDGFLTENPMTPGAVGAQENVEREAAGLPPFSAIGARARIGKSLAAIGLKEKDITAILATSATLADSRTSGEDALDTQGTDGQLLNTPTDDQGTAQPVYDGDGKLMNAGVLAEQEVVEGSGMRVEGSLSKATNEGVVGGTVSGLVQVPGVKHIPKLQHVAANAMLGDEAAIRVFLTGNFIDDARIAWQGAVPFDELSYKWRSYFSQQIAVAKSLGRQLTDKGLRDVERHIEDLHAAESKTDAGTVVPHTSDSAGVERSKPDGAGAARNGGRVGETAGAPVEPNFDAIPDVVQRANAKWKYHKGDLTKLSDDEVTAVSDRAKKFGNATLASAANAELEARAAKKVNQDAIGPGAAEAAAVNRDVTGPNVPGNGEAAQFSKATKGEGSTAAQVIADLKAFIRLGGLGNKITVVQSVSDLPADIQRSVNPDAGTQGFVVNGKAYLVADNIAKGKARSVFLHEVGAHLGLENLLGKAQYAALVAKVKQWAAKDDSSQEHKIAKAAQQRVKYAGTDAAQADTELVAYFIEEAVDAGVDPTATKADTEFGRWFRAVWAAFKVALHKLGVNPDKLTAQDVVDMAYGAAKLELAGENAPVAGAHKLSVARGEAKVNQTMVGWVSDVWAGRVQSEMAGISQVPPPVLKMLGFWNPIVIDAKHALHIRDTHPEITPQDIGALADLISRPRVVLKGNEEGKLELALDARTPDGDPLLVILTKGKTGNFKIIGVSTLYGKEDSALWLTRKAAAGQVLYMKKNEVARLHELQATALIAVNRGGIPSAPSTQSGRPPASSAAPKPSVMSNSVLTDAALDKYKQNANSNWRSETVELRASTDAAALGGVKFSKAAKYAPAQEAAMQYLKVIGSKGSNGLVKMMLTSDLLANANGFLKGIPLKYKAAMDAITAEKTKQERHVADIVEEFSKLPKHEQGKGDSSVNAVLKASTMTDVWPFVPDWLPKGTVKVDPEATLTKRFNALSKPGQALVPVVGPQEKQPPHT